eukprot:3635060-Amphidinium_carterae.2
MGHLFVDFGIGEGWGQILSFLLVTHAHHSRMWLEHLPLEALEDALHPCSPIVDCLSGIMLC